MEYRSRKILVALVRVSSALAFGVCQAVFAMSYEAPYQHDRTPTSTASETHFGNIPKSSSLSAVHYVAPEIIQIELKKGDPFVEVFVVGRVPNNCFSQHEVTTQKLENKTRFVVRFRKPEDSIGCEKGPSDFRIKLADLDPNVESSKRIEVLGHKGWSEARSQ